MSKSRNSYNVETFEYSEQAEELNRLAYQAQVLLPPNLAFLESVGLRPGMKVLDLGCGNGLTSCQIAEEMDLKAVIGVDRSTLMLEKAEVLKAEKGITNVEFQQGNAQQLDFSAASFDFVYARLLFQHLANPGQALAEIQRVLKPGGILCLVDIDDSWFGLYPEPASFSELTRHLLGIQQTQGGDPWVGRKLGSHMHEAGFVDVQTHIEVVTSEQIGLETFLRLLSFGVPYASQKDGLSEIAAQAQADVYDLLNQPYAWAGVGLFVVTAQKPRSSGRA